MGWGGVIASGIAGAIGGAAQAGVDDIVERQKQEALRLRDAALAQLQQQTYAANRQTDINNIGQQQAAEAAAKLANAPTVGQAERAQWDNGSSYVAGQKMAMDVDKQTQIERARPMAPGHSYVSGHDEQGNPTFVTAPSDKATSGYYEAATEKERAQAAESRARAAKEQAQADAGGFASGAGNKTTKFDIASFTPITKDALGNITEGIDQQTGVRFMKIPGKEGTPGDPGWNIPLIGNVGATPEVPSTPSTIKYFDKTGKEITFDEAVTKYYPKGASARDAANTVDTRSPVVAVDTGTDGPLAPMDPQDKAQLSSLLKDYWNAAGADSPNQQQIADIQKKIRAITNKPGFLTPDSGGVVNSTSGPAPAAAPAAPAEPGGGTGPAAYGGTPQYGPPARDPKTGVVAHKNLLTGKWERM